MAANVAGMAFIPYYSHIIRIIETDPELKKSFNGIVKQVCWSAGGTAFGGVVGGPLGAAIGGVVGAVLGYKMSDEYSAVIDIFKTMSDENKQQLVQKVQELVGSTSLEALTKFIASQVCREQFACLIRDFADQVKAGG